MEAIPLSGAPICADIVVEARGVEPLSESSKIRLSPGAAQGLIFPAFTSPPVQGKRAVAS